MVIRCSVLWWFPVLPWLSDVVFCGCFLFDLLLSNVVFCSGFHVLPWFSDVVFCGGCLFDHGYEIYCSVFVSCFTMVIRCSVLWWFPVYTWLFDVVFCSGLVFDHGY